MTRINEEIRSPQVRLIDSEGNQLGVVSNQEAQQRAIEISLDLVEIAPNANPPVCRLMDYRKYVFEQNKAAKKKKSKNVVKEITFRPNTDNHDVEIKLRKIIAFLEEGDKVRISLRYRGREISHQEIGVQLMERLKADIEPFGQVEQEPKFEGRQIMMLLGPKKKEPLRKGID